MPLSLVLTLEPLEAASLPANLGRASHALLLRLLEGSSPAVASCLHDEEGPKPFTVSNLWGAERGEQGTVVVSPESHCWLRFTSLDNELSDLLQQQFLGGGVRRVELDRTVFGVVAATADPEDNAWAGVASYGQLSEPYLLARENPRRRVGLEFATPTTFRSGGMNVPVPMPELVFGSLVERWNAFAPVAVSEEVRRYVAGCVAVSRYRLQSRFVPFGQAGQVGCLGECQYVAVNRDRYWLGLVNLLADFALYSGVGYKTTMGLGQARRIRDRR